MGVDVGVRVCGLMIVWERLMNEKITSVSPSHERIGREKRFINLRSYREREREMMRDRRKKVEGKR